MLLSDINPYIRYAAKATLNKKPGLYKAIDHHMFFINDGEEKIVINGVCRQLKKNNFFIIPANTPYEFILRKPILFTSINYDYTQQRRHKTEPVFPVTADTVLGDGDILDEKFSDNDILNNPIFITDGQFAAADMEKIIFRHRFSEQFSSIKNSILLKDLLIDIVKNALTPKNQNERINKIIEYIQKNFNRDISNEDIAARFNLHPYYLNKIFSLQTGKTLHQYLLNYRIKTAEQLLISTSYPVKKIAEEVGFNSTVIFIKNFKAENRQTPSEYREYFRYFT